MIDYFQEELNYLYKAGKEFAEDHPELAKYLNIESLKDRDPYVERLFEGFAFLVGRIQRKLDDDVPEFSEEMLNLLVSEGLVSEEIAELLMLGDKPRPPC